MWTFNREDVKVTHRVLSWDEDESMSLDVWLEVNGEEVFAANITHNLGKMASKVSDFFYKAMWRPEELGAKFADDIILDLRSGVARLVTSPNYYKQFNPENGWGEYMNLVEFAIKYIEACQKYPYAALRVSR